MKHQIPHWHRGLHAIHLGFLGGLVAVTLVGSLLLSVLSPLWLKQADAAVTSFASSSFWNASTPSYTALSPDSAVLSADVVRQVGQFGTAFAKDAGASPVYVAEPNANTVSVTPYDCGSGILAGLGQQLSAVPIPFFAVPSGDGQMVVYQPSSSTVWELGQARNVSGQWEACTGGRLTTTGDGVFAAPYGVSSSGLAALGAQLSIQELQAAQINHVIGLRLPQTNGVVWPATQSGGSTSGSPAMGQRFRLDPAVDIDTLGLSPLATAIAKAGQTYGFVVWNGGSTVGFTGENAASMTTRGLPDPYGSILAGGGLSGFPWDKLQALPSAYGQSPEVPAITQFGVSQTSVQSGSRVTLSWQSTNVSRCTIAGLADGLAASGSTQSKPLGASTTFVLRCGGPAGTASSHVSVTVTPTGSNDPAPSLPPSMQVDQPYSGYANVLPELMSAEAAAQVYKVVYYERETYLAETAKPPFALNTARMSNGPHTVEAQVYYRGGTTERKSARIIISNSPETLFATTQSGVIRAVPSIPPIIGIVGLLLVAAAMSAGTWWGWHKAHL